MSEFRSDDPRHGTYAGKQRHRVLGERPCEPCRLAYNAYMRDRRERNPTAKTKSQRVSRASSRAVWRLKAHHPDEYAALYANELARQSAEVTP